MVSKGATPALALAMRLPMLHCGAGVLAGALAFGFRYLAQALYAYDRLKPAHTLNAASILLALAGYGAFGWGPLGACEGIMVR